MVVQVIGRWVAGAQRQWARWRRWRWGFKRVARKELSWDVPLRLRQPRFWRKGFLSSSVVLYGLDRNETQASAYVTDLQRYTKSKNMVHRQLQDLLDNKVAFHNLLTAIDLPKSKVPLLGIYVRGAVHRFPGEERVPLEVFLRDLPIGEKVFMKPIRGAEGRNLFAIDRTERGYELNRVPVEPEALRGLIEEPKRPFVIEEGVVQHADLDRLFPYSTNTMRVLTMLDMSTREPFIAVAVQRIGTKRSAPVDNWTQGGLSARIDPDSGLLSAAAQMPASAELAWHDVHPDTGVQIKGALAPHWDEVRDLVLHVANVLSFVEYVGWDIIVSEHGPVILEANTNTGLNVLQVHGPLLADPRVKRYYRKRGVV